MSEIVLSHHCLAVLSALVKGAKASGFDVFTTLEDLLNFLANH